MLLIMGYTSRKALQVKVAYLHEFERLQLENQRLKDSLVQSQLNDLKAKLEHQKEDQNKPQSKLPIKLEIPEKEIYEQLESSLLSSLSNLILSVQDKAERVSDLEKASIDTNIGLGTLDYKTEQGFSKLEELFKELEYTLRNQDTKASEFEIKLKDIRQWSLKFRREMNRLVTRKVANEGSGILERVFEIEDIAIKFSNKVEILEKKNKKLEKRVRLLEGKDNVVPMFKHVPLVTNDPFSKKVDKLFS